MLSVYPINSSELCIERRTFASHSSALTIGLLGPTVYKKIERKRIMFINNKNTKQEGYDSLQNYLLNYSQHISVLTKTHLKSS